MTIRRHLALLLGASLAVAACGATPGPTDGGPPGPSSAPGTTAPVATAIAGADPTPGQTVNPDETPPSGGPIPSYGLASPFIAANQASFQPAPSLPPGATELKTFLISPADYFSERVREGSTLTVYEDGSIRIDSVRDQTGDNKLEWRLPEEQWPAIEDVVEVFARGCGWGDGDFYEIYGPWDSVEFEYEVTPPAQDGCWHFSQAVGKSYEFEIWLHGNSTMTINRLELTVALR